MAVDNITGSIIATGANVQVRVGQTSDNCDTILGLASNVSYTENFQTQDAVVIGHLGPISIDPNGYQCEITIGSFVPSKRTMAASGSYGANVTKEVTEFLPDRASIEADGTKKAFQSLDFYNAKTGVVLAKFSGVIITNAGMNVDGNAYMKANVQMRALERVKLTS